MKKILAMLLVLLMLSATLLSCKKQGGENGESNGDVEAPTGSVETNESGYVLDRLPADLSAYNGKNVRLLGWNGQAYQTIPKEDSADDPVASTLYQHWRGLEDRFGITFTTVYTDSEYSNFDKFKTDAIADNGHYDLIQTQSLFPITLAEEGYLCNLMNLNYPDLAKNEDGSTVMPWWPDSVSEYSQHGALYFINSNSSAMTISQMAVIFVNTPLIASKGLASPITSVVRGSWTVAEMENIVKQFTAEAEAAPAANRVYGFAWDHYSRLDRLYYASGQHGVVNNADGVGSLAYDDTNELLQITAALEEWKGIFQENRAALYGDSSGAASDDTTVLRENRTALFLGFMEQIREIPNVEIWTVAPMPKLNYEQENYATTFRDLADVWCMPTTTQDVTMSGMILEAMACSEYNTVAPFYFEQYLKDRYSNGVEGRQCFDILRDSILYDLGNIGTLVGFGAHSTFTKALSPSYSNNFAETIQGSLTTHQTNLSDLISNFEKYKDNGKPQ